MLADLPFMIPLIAGTLAGGSAALLRRAAPVYGVWLDWLSLGASVASAGGFAAGFLWAATMPPVPEPSVLQTFAGMSLALAGSVLAGWSLRRRGLGVLRVWRPDRFEQQLPYRALRRPLELGVMLAVFGLCWLRPAPPVWSCFAVWIVLWNLVLELGDWELRGRLPSGRDYFKRTPRYLPRREMLGGAASR